MNRYYVYAYFDGDVPIYIGAGCKDRDTSHLKSWVTRCPYLHNKLCKMRREGREPVIRRLLEGLTFRESRDWECFFILAIGRKNLGVGPLYNLTDGGEGTVNVIRSDIIRQRTSLAVKAYYARPGKRQYRSAAAKAASARLETKQRMSAAAKIVRRRRLPKGRFKGVFPNRKKWAAKIDGKHLGSFLTPEEAAQAYNDGVDKYWGGDGYKNQIPVAEK